MILREWQNECVLQALNHYQNLNKHFLCLATPGSGKTVMAAEIAAKLFSQDKIDFVLCFSPSINVSKSISTTFSMRFNARFDGIIGALGSSYTYQNILFFDKEFWQIFRNNRVMVVFDEIHHCAGTSIENANAWGEEILLNIQQQAEYTLALTGTPWRSDKMPIVLSNYNSSGEKSIQCDYTYGLKEAVRDNVCRSPKLVLIDNEKLVVTDKEKEKQTFTSFKALIDGSKISYQSVITHPEFIKHILSKACNKLSEIRCSNVKAGGLVVASSVEHANLIINMLRNEFNQTAVLVTYKQAHASNMINKYRQASTQWIVSVGMVSEGTDIPRLQVCCHLSRIKTEMYFRQVLGRILRITQDNNQEAWLYTFAEPTLSEFSKRIEEDLPEQNIIIKETLPHRDDSELPNVNNRENFTNREIDLGENFNVEDSGYFSTENQSFQYGNSHLCTLEILGQFRDQVIATFDSPF